MVQKMRKMKDSGIEWIGEIPEGWELIKAKYLFSQRNEKGNSTLVLLSPTQKYGVIPQSQLEGVVQVKETTDLRAFKTIHIGDFVISLRSFQGGFEFSNYEGVCSPAYQVFHATKDLSNDFFRYLFKSDGFISKINSLTVGIREGKNIQYWDFSNMLLAVPPKEIQIRSAQYLNAKCTEIDTMLSKTRSSIEEYKKLKQAVITQAVATQQCSHIKLKYLMNVIVDCPHETPTYSFTGNYYVIRTADQALASLRRDEDMYRLDASEYKKRTRRLTLYKDDIVYGREGERWGLACIVPESNKYCLGQRIMQFRCNTKFLYPKYAMYALNSEPVYLQGVADTIGSTSPHVNISTICNYLLPVPALSEQKEITNYLDAKCAEIDGLIAKKEQLVKELESYKKSLIYEVVTGKRDV